MPKLRTEAGIGWTFGLRLARLTRHKPLPIRELHPTERNRKFFRIPTYTRSYTGRDTKMLSIKVVAPSERVPTGGVQKSRGFGSAPAIYVFAMPPSARNVAAARQAARGAQPRSTECCPLVPAAIWILSATRCPDLGGDDDGGSSSRANWK